MDLLSDNKLENVSMRQIGLLVGINHPQNVKHHLAQLEKRGLIKFDRDSKIIQSVRKMSESSEGLVSLPIYGAANCGVATHFADNYVEGYLKVSKNLLKKSNNIFILQASGDSMNKAQVDGRNIEDGDYVVVDSEYNQPRNGDYIVSVIDGLGNIKKYYEDHENQQVVLMPESTKNYPPIFIGLDEIDNYCISGRVIQVIKKPKI